jgi:hypothetical protein
VLLKDEEQLTKIKPSIFERDGPRIIFYDDHDEVTEAIEQN